VLGLDNCLPDNVVDHKLGDGRGAILFVKSCKDSLWFELSLEIRASCCELCCPNCLSCTCVALSLSVSDGHVPTSFPPQSYCGGLDKGRVVVEPLDGGHGNHLGRVLGAVAGGGDRGGPVNYLASADNDCRDQVLLLC
jgi:hypothetical protein